MTVPQVTALLRPGLLAGLPVAVADPLRPALVEALTTLGADLRDLDAAEVDALVVDAGAAEGDVIDVAARVWAAVRDVANAAWIEPHRPGKLVVVTSSTDAAQRAALENLARTTSIEWARFGIRSVAVRPGPRTTDEETAALVAYLLSPAGDYFSGTALDLS